MGALKQCLCLVFTNNINFYHIKVSRLTITKKHHTERFSKIAPRGILNRYSMEKATLVHETHFR